MTTPIPTTFSNPLEPSEYLKDASMLIAYNHLPDLEKSYFFIMLPQTLTLLYYNKIGTFICMKAYKFYRTNVELIYYNNDIYHECYEISKMISGLIKSVDRKIDKEKSKKTFEI